MTKEEGINQVYGGGGHVVISTWARQVLKAAAIKQHRDAGLKITFLKPTK